MRFRKDSEGNLLKIEEKKEDWIVYTAKNLVNVDGKKVLELRIKGEKDSYYIPEKDWKTYRDKKLIKERDQVVYVDPSINDKIVRKIKK